MNLNHNKRLPIQGEMATIRSIAFASNNEWFHYKQQVLNMIITT